MIPLFNSLRTFTIAIPLLVAGSQAASAQETFEYKGKAGDKHSYRTSVTSSSSQKVAGMDLKSEFTLTTISERNFKEPDEDGNLKYESATKQVLVDASLPGLGKFKFDSESDENESGSQLADSLAPFFQATADAKFDVKLTKLGEVVELQGYADALKDVLKGNPLAQQFAGGGTDEAAKAGVSDLFIQFKKEGVNTGDEWEVEFKINLPNLGEATGKRRIRFDGDDKVGDTPTKKFTVTLELAFDVNIKSGGAKVTGKIESESSSGEYHFDPAIGQIISGKMKQVLSGTLTAAVGDKEIKVETSQTQNVKIERLEKRPQPKAPATTEKTTEKTTE